MYLHATGAETPAIPVAGQISLGAGGGNAADRSERVSALVYALYVPPTLMPTTVP